MKNKFFKRIAVQTSLYYLLFTVLAVVISAVLLYSALSSIIMEQSITYTKNSLENSGEYIDDYLNKLDFITNNLSSNPQINRFVSSSSGLEPSLESDVLSIIDSTIESDQFLKSILIISKDGNILPANQADYDGELSSDMTKQEWYEHAVHCSGMPMLSGAKMTELPFEKSSWVISLSKDICDETGAHLGLIIVEVDYHVIEDYIMRQDLGSLGYAFILDNNGELVFHHDPAYFTDREKIAELNEFAKMDIGYDHKTNTLLHKYKINNDHWTLIAVNSMDELTAMNVRMMNIFILIMGLLIIIVISIAVYISRRVTKPIRKLEKKMREFDESFKLIELDDDACYEAQSLSIHFNEMIKTIKILVNEIEFNANSMKLYELNALRSQINPHFLYNTLDTIIWMAEFKDHKQVIDITKSLASFFRLSLSNGEEQVALESEIEHVKQYLYIQSKRYEEMQYHISVDDAVKGIKIPKIIVQPIVENAIYHGIRQKEGVGVIDISAYKEENDIMIKITDNGVGFNKGTKNSAEQKAKLGGVGISNVDQRIKLAYGKDYGVEIESEIGKGTCVTLRLKA